LVAALASGNTVIFKPSEKTPASAQKLAECFQHAQFPKGVFNLVQGGADIAQSLVTHPAVQGVFFTGSYETGLKLKKQILPYPDKILALEMGGKNSAVIWDFEDLDNAVLETLKGAFLTTGQRCSSTSRLILHSRIKEPFLEKFLSYSQRLKIGHWQDKVFMGPLINQEVMDRFFSSLQEAKEEGAFIHLEGQKQEHLNGYYVSPSIVEPLSFQSQSFHQNQELFVPHLNVYTSDYEEEAFHLANQSGYGLCVSLFSQEQKFIEKAFQTLHAGVFHCNFSSNGASPYLPFGGVRKSGNGRPAGLLAITSCVTPIAWQTQKGLLKKKVTFPTDFFQKENG